MNIAARPNKSIFKLLVYLSLYFSFSLGACAQPIGQCFDQIRNQSFTIFDNYYAVQDGFPMNGGVAMRDPSGMNFLRMPSLNPAIQTFYVNWQGQIIEINPAGWRLIGYCHFIQPVQTIAQPPLYNSAPVQYSQWRVRYAHINTAIPNVLADHNIRYTPPMLVNRDLARECLRQGDAEADESEFLDCIADKTLTGNQHKSYKCVRQYSDTEDKNELGLCILKSNMGKNEQRAFEQVEICYKEHRNDWDQYPACLASQNFDERTARAVGCIKQQTESASFSYWGLATCYGAGELHMNPEATVAAECAMTSGGQPLVFMGCTGGRLTAMELQKCIDHGIGKDGCFGPNNEIVKALRSVGQQLNSSLGENNSIAMTWNNSVTDISEGPGPNNDIARTLSNVANDLNNGPGRGNDIVQGVDKVIPGFADLF
ncbi:MAG: hypothetical protein ACXVA2_18715 [Mucilaginibacter sp.]